MTALTEVVKAESLLASPDGYEVLVRIPWYRSLPLASLVELEIELDGVTADIAASVIHIDGREFTLTSLAETWQEFWFVQDWARVTVPAAPVARGETHELRVRAAFSIPYIIVGPRTPLLNVVEETVTVTAQ